MKSFLIIAIVLAVFFIPVFLFVKAETLTVIVINPSFPECSDGLDNDADGLIDFPNDPGCSSALDNDETNLPASFCGDGNCDSGENCSNCPADCGVCPSGGGRGYTPATRVIFSGRAYPLSKVILLKDAQLAVQTIAGPDANFQIDLSGLSAGNYIFCLYSEDSHDRHSSLFTFPISITYGATTNVSGIFIAPTIDVDKSEVKRGDNLAIFGQSAADSEITISINSDQEIFKKTQADNSGIYLYNLDTAPLEIGQHFTKSKAALNGEISSFSKAVSFAVGTITVPKEKVECGKADLNGDDRINLVDFSIAAYWYKRSSPPANIDLNSDGKVDLVDFSIMAYYWTG
ncbi:dockerin type I repeat-containing protein [Candidatus Parcubacteria bacterium]|nr:dockerin type I repeat-containing protein [Candidatus Parcubacteria bacterium]